MEKTVGSTDKIIRIVLAIAIGYFAYATSFEAVWLQTVLYVVSTVLFITAFTGICALYSIFKVNTCKINQ